MTLFTRRWADYKENEEIPSLDFVMSYLNINQESHIKKQNTTNNNKKIKNIFEHLLDSSSDEEDIQ